MRALRVLDALGGVGGVTAECKKFGVAGTVYDFAVDPQNKFRNRKFVRSICRLVRRRYFVAGMFHTPRGFADRDTIEVCGAEQAFGALEAFAREEGQFREAPDRAIVALKATVKIVVKQPSNEEGRCGEAHRRG